MAEQPTATPAAAVTTLTTAASDLEFELTRDVIYHRSRQAWYDGLHRWVMFLNVTLGAAAIAPFFPAAVSGVVITVVSTVDLVADFEGRGRFYSERQRKYSELAEKLVEGSTSTDTLALIRRQMIQLSSEERSPFRAAVMAAYNQAIVATGRDTAYKRNITQRQFFFRHVIRFEADDFPQQS